MSARLINNVFSGAAFTAVQYGVYSLVGLALKVSSATLPLIGKTAGWNCYGLVAAAPYAAFFLTKITTEILVDNRVMSQGSATLLQAAAFGVVLTASLVMVSSMSIFATPVVIVMGVLGGIFFLSYASYGISQLNNR